MYRISYRHSKKIATRALPGSPLTRRDQVLLALLSRTSDAVPVTYGDTNPHLSSVSELRHLSNCVSPGTQRPVPASSLRPSLSTPPPPPIPPLPRPPPHTHIARVPCRISLHARVSAPCSRTSRHASRTRTTSDCKRPSQACPSALLPFCTPRSPHPAPTPPPPPRIGLKRLGPLLRAGGGDGSGKLAQHRAHRHRGGGAHVAPPRERAALARRVGLARLVRLVRLGASAG